MKILISVLMVMLLCLLGSPLGAQETDDVLVLSTGTSRGPHQAGAMLTLIEARRGDKPFRGFVGASAGSFNALMGALIQCRGSEGPDAATLLGLWDTLEIERLLPQSPTDCDLYPESFEGECTEPIYGKYDGVFTNTAFGAVRKTFEQALSARYTPKCRTVVSIALGLVEPEEVPLDAFDVPTSRAMTAFELMIDAEGRPHFCALPRLAFDDLTASAGSGVQPNSPWRTLFLQPRVLPNTACSSGHEVPAEEVLQMIQAAVSLPPLFWPLDVEHCVSKEIKEQLRDKTTVNVKTAQSSPTKQRTPDSTPALAEPKGEDPCPPHFDLRKGRLMDGALFDPVPLTVADDVHGQQARYIYLDSRPDIDPKGSGAPRGFPFFFDLFVNFLTVTQDYEIRTLFRYKPQLPNRIYDVPNTRLLMANYLVGYASFIHKDFRRFDFAVGVFDALKWLEKSQSASFDALLDQMKETDGFERILPPDARHVLCGMIKDEEAKTQPKRALMERLCSGPALEDKAQSRRLDDLLKVTRPDHSDDPPTVSRNMWLHPSRQFREFVQRLDADLWRDQGDAFTDPGRWTYTMGSRVLSRLKLTASNEATQELPKTLTESLEDEEMLLGLSAHVMRQEAVRLSQGGLIAGTVGGWKEVVIPEALHFDLAQGGARLKWDIGAVYGLEPDSWSTPLMRMTFDLEIRFLRFTKDTNDSLELSLPVGFGVSRLVENTNAEIGIRWRPWVRPLQIGGGQNGLSVGFGGELYLLTLSSLVEVSVGLNRVYDFENHFRLQSNKGDQTLVMIGFNGLFDLLAAL